MAITFSAGDRITAATLNAFVPMYITKSVDETRTVTTSSNDATFAGISFGANETWVCELVLDVDGPTAADIKIIWSTTGGASMSRRHSMAMGVSGTAQNDALNISAQSRAGNSSTSYGTAPDSGTIRGTVQEKFVVTCTTAGTITMQWAQASGPSGTTTVRAGSYFVAHRVA